MMDVFGVLKDLQDGHDLKDLLESLKALNPVFKLS